MFFDPYGMALECRVSNVRTNAVENGILGFIYTKKICNIYGYANFHTPPWDLALWNTSYISLSIRNWTMPSLHQRSADIHYISRTFWILGIRIWIGFRNLISFFTKTFHRDSSNFTTRRVSNTEKSSIVFRFIPLTALRMNFIKCHIVLPLDFANFSLTSHLWIYKQPNTPNNVENHGSSENHPRIEYRGGNTYRIFLASDWNSHLWNNESIHQILKFVSTRTQMRFFICSSTIASWNSDSPIREYSPSL